MNTATAAASGAAATSRAALAASLSSASMPAGLALVMLATTESSGLASRAHLMVWSIATPLLSALTLSAPTLTSALRRTEAILILLDLSMIVVILTSKRLLSLLPIFSLLARTLASTATALWPSHASTRVVVKRGLEHERSLHILIAVLGQVVVRARLLVMLTRWGPFRPTGLLMIAAFFVVWLPLHLLTLVPDLIGHVDFKIVVVVCDLVLLRRWRQAGKNVTGVVVGRSLIVPSVSVVLVRLLLVVIFTFATEASAPLELLFGLQRRPVWVSVLRLTGKLIALKTMPLVLGPHHIRCLASGNLLDRSARDQLHLLETFLVTLVDLSRRCVLVDLLEGSDLLFEAAVGLLEVADVVLLLLHHPQLHVELTLELGTNFHLCLLFGVDHY